MSSPTIAVVIPTHNRSDIVTHAIDSVLAQSYPAAEVIVVDDCSSDDTQEVLAGYGDRIITIRNEENRERGASRNVGLRAATSDLVAFLDSDDRWLPQKLERQIELFGDRDVFSCTGARRVGIDGQDLATPWIPPADASEQIYFANTLTPASSSLARRETLLSIGGFPEEREVQGSEDWIFACRIKASGTPIEVIPEPLVLYTVHPDNSTADPAYASRSMWCAVEQMIRGGVIPEPLAPQARSSAAGRIALRFAAAGAQKSAFEWARTAHQSNPGPSASDMYLSVLKTATWATVSRTPIRRRRWVMSCVNCGHHSMMIVRDGGLARCLRCGYARSSLGLEK